MYKMFSIARAGRVAAVSGLVAVGASAHAALPTAVTTALSDAGTDLMTAATAVVVAVAGFWGLKLVGKKLGLWA